MAFGVQELRVLRRALALALNPSPVSAEDVQDCLRLAESLDEAMRESARLRAFLVADLARYRAALPGTAVGYLTLMGEALDAGHRPGADDLAALRALRGNPTAQALLSRCRADAEPPGRPRTAPLLPAARTPLLALPGGRSDAAARDAAKPEKKPAQKPGPQPSPAAPQTPKRPIPTPGEVFPRRKPSSPPAGSRHHLAAG
ncbi:hypothetical protein H0H10_25485 [Streptomyces sp. TRM S81-3]|uniref:Uncharacterized protein n=2 Tax=Streptomyces griseicoloratus TaxID=2752516 RepID=A0A926QSW6_9ACTN|nr:hypothetical protein [Streptomyces griseicoloratus]